LARWIAHEQNPLFARVIVNRMWHYHFGAGLVDTPSDFGFNGGRPTHPELLDWLAGELIRHNWSLKALQRIILSSATYRQAATTNSKASQVDAENRLLWRKSPRRLDAELVRDTILAVSGALNETMEGPGYEDYTTFTRNTQFYVPFDPVGPSFNRRTLYRNWIRSGRNPFLDVFDCPDPSTKTPKRAVTTTPLQALTLLNNTFVLRLSDDFASRIERDAGTGPTRQITRLWDLAFARTPSEEELHRLLPFVNEHGLPALCRVVFNSSEFLYAD
jgi:hypothetical protein